MSADGPEVVLCLHCRVPLPDHTAICAFMSEARREVVPVAVIIAREYGTSRPAELYKQWIKIPIHGDAYRQAHVDARSANANRLHWKALYPQVPYIEDARDRENYLLNEIGRLSGKEKP